MFHSFSLYYVAAFGHSVYNSLLLHTYTNLHNFFSTLWKHLTQKLCGVCMERAQVIHGNRHRHLGKLLNNFTVDFIKLVTVLPCICTTLQYSAYVVVRTYVADQHAYSYSGSAICTGA